MGILSFLKKEKTDAGPDMPPALPRLPDASQASTLKDDIPSLPPLPEEIPESVPPLPLTEERLPEPPKAKLTKKEQVPPLEAISKKTKIETPKPEFPEIPANPALENIPDTIPPLEDIQEPEKSFETEKESDQNDSAEELPPHEVLEDELPEMPEMPAGIPENLPESYVAEEIEKEPVKGPLFLKTDAMKAILDDITQIKAKFKVCTTNFQSVRDIKTSQDKEFETFRQALEDVQRKLLFIDKTIFENR